MTYEAMTQSGRTGYCEDVVTARQNGEKRLATYQETLGKIEEKLTDNDKAYYAQVYEGSWKPENKMPKWAALGGAVLFVLAGGWFALAFLLDGSVKGTDELEDRYGLHLLARVEPEGAAKKNLRGLDKLFAEKPQYNDGGVSVRRAERDRHKRPRSERRLGQCADCADDEDGGAGGGIQGLRSLRGGRSGRCG